MTDRLLADTSPALRDVLAAAAVVRQFDEDLLSEVAGVDVRPHAATLARLAVVRPGEHGLCLHDDVRRLLRDTLRSTLPDRYATLRSRALACYRRRMAGAPPEVRERLVNEQLYLWDNEVVGPARPRRRRRPSLGPRSHRRGSEAILALWDAASALVNPLQGGAPDRDLSRDELLRILDAPTGRLTMVTDDGRLLAFGPELTIQADRHDLLPRILQPIVRDAHDLWRRDRPAPRYLGPIVGLPGATAAMARLARYGIGSWIHGGTVLLPTTLPGFAAVMGRLGAEPLVPAYDLDGLVVVPLGLTLRPEDVDDWIARVVALTPPPVAVPDAAAAYAPTVGLATAASPTASITLIGGFRVHRAGEDVTPTGAPATAVKRLALSGRVLHVEELAADLWPDTDASTGRVRLRNVVRRARTHVEDLIVRDGEYLRIGDDVTIDTEVLPNELSRLRELAVTDPVRALRELREVLPATGLEVLPGEPEDELLEATRARVRRDALRGLDLTAELASRAGDPGSRRGAPGGHRARPLRRCALRHGRRPPGPPRSPLGGTPAAVPGASGRRGARRPGLARRRRAGAGPPG